jgi:hypothetical protein
MSRPRYAPITSNLLVRKGDAKPWNMPSALDFAPRATEETPAPRPWDNDPPPHRPPAPSDGGNVFGGEHDKRCTLKLTHRDYERLGIIAVKKEVSRQQVLRQAIEHYLAAAAQEYRSACGCLGGACRGGC